jgi:hypothetical protein
VARNQTSSATTSATADTTATADSTETATERKSQADRMLKRNKAVDGDKTLEFAAGVRALAEELEERLATEITGPLAGMEAEVNDPQSGRLVASSQRLRAHVVDVQRELRALSAAAGALGQDAIV